MRIALALALSILARVATAQFLPPPFGELIIPAAASAHGLADTFFRSDLWVVNQSTSQPIALNLGYLCRTGCSALQPGPDYLFVLAPGQSRLFQDVVTSIFSEPETSGALDIYEPGNIHTTPFFATSRTYTSDASRQGSYGTAVPAFSWAQATRHAMFIGLASNGGDLSDGFRLNAGVFVYCGCGSITYRLMDSNGRTLGTPLTVQAQVVQQVNDVFRAVGVGNAVLFDAVLEVTSDFPAHPYVTVIDNRSGDSIFLPGAFAPLSN
jgi:hypothetical protein